MLSLALLAAVLRSVSGQSNFCLDGFDGQQVAFPVGVCAQYPSNPDNPLSYASVKYMCSAGGVERCKFTDTACDDADGACTSINATSCECGGENNYGVVNVYLADSSCTGDGLASLSLATGVCMEHPYIEGQYVQASCTASEATIAAYSDSDCQTADGAAITAPANNCTWMYNYEGVADVYAKAAGCYVNVVDTTPQPSAENTDPPASTNTEDASAAQPDVGTGHEDGTDGDDYDNRVELDVRISVLASESLQHVCQWELMVDAFERTLLRPEEDLFDAGSLFVRVEDGECLSETNDILFHADIKLKQFLLNVPVALAIQEDDVEEVAQIYSQALIDAGDADIEELQGHEWLDSCTVSNIVRTCLSDRCRSAATMNRALGMAAVAAAGIAAVAM